MYLNMKKIYRYFVMFIIGLSMVFYGIIQMVVVDHSQQPPTDAEVIERARELGMIQLNEYYLEKDEETE